MPTGWINLSLLLPAWALVLARAGGLVMTVPLFSSQTIPAAFRAFLAVAVAVVMFPAAARHLPADLSMSRALSGMAGEMLIGIALGLAGSVVLLASQLAGQFVSQQAGLSLGEVFNPLFDSEGDTLQEAWFFVTMAAFISVGGLTALTGALLSSFEALPPLSMGLAAGGDSGAAWTAFAAGILSMTYELALRLAAPALVTLLLSTLVMGFLVRTMPQFNVLTVGFSVKVVLALVMVAVTFTRSGDVLTESLRDGLDAASRLMTDLGREAARAG